MHYYFGSVDELLLQTLERFTDRILERQRAMYETDTPFVEKWRTAMGFIDEDLAQATPRSGQSSVRQASFTACSRSRISGLVQAERFEFRPDLGISRLKVLLDVAHCGAPLLREGRIGPTHRPLAVEDAGREPLQRLQQQLVDRAEVVVDEAVVLPGLRASCRVEIPAAPSLTSSRSAASRKASTLASLIEGGPPRLHSCGCEPLVI